MADSPEQNGTSARLPDYVTDKAYKDALERDYAEASARLKALPCIGEGRLGLTPDWVKRTDEYRHAKMLLDGAFKRLCGFNSYFIGRWAKEYKADLLAQRQAKKEQP